MSRNESTHKRGIIIADIWLLETLLVQFVPSVSNTKGPFDKEDGVGEV